MPELIVVGDRVLIEPDDGEQLTASGLVLPATVAERERVGFGHVVSVGPGHLVPNPEFVEGEPWNASKEAGRYLPLQAKAGDFAFFVRKESVELTYKEQKYLILPHHAILALVRPNREDIIDEILEVGRP